MNKHEKDQKILLAVIVKGFILIFLYLPIPVNVTSVLITGFYLVHFMGESSMYDGLELATAQYSTVYFRVLSNTNSTQ